MDSNMDDQFPNFDELTQLLLMKIMKFLRNFTSQFLLFQAIVSIIGIFLLIFHLFILSRKDMRSSSTNVFMIGLAIYDIGLMILHLFVYFDSAAGCSQSYKTKTFELLTQIVGSDLFRRCTSWLAIMMAITRVIIIKKAMDHRFDFLSKSKSGWYTILTITLVSVLIGFLHYFCYYIGPIDGEDLYCKSPGKTRSPFLYVFLNEHIMPYYLYVNGIVSKIIPCISLPLLTIILVVELQKANKKRSEIMSGKNSETSDRTTKLVTYIAVSFMIAELPQGLNSFLAAYFYDDGFGFMHITDDLGEIFMLISYLNGSTHGIICYAMSNKYRLTVKNLFKTKKLEKKAIFTNSKSKTPHSTASIGKVQISL